MNVANVKSVKKCSPGGGEGAAKCPEEHPACTDLLCRATANNCL